MCVWGGLFALLVGVTFCLCTLMPLLMSVLGGLNESNYHFVSLFHLLSKDNALISRFRDGA